MFLILGGHKRVIEFNTPNYGFVCRANCSNEFSDSVVVTLHIKIMVILQVVLDLYLIVSYVNSTVDSEPLFTKVDYSVR